MMIANHADKYSQQHDIGKLKTVSHWAEMKGEELECELQLWNYWVNPLCSIDSEI